MNLLKNSLLCLIVFNFIVGCAALKTSNEYMAVKEPKKNYTPNAEQALIIFERANARAGEFSPAALWDISDRNGDPKLIAILHPTMKSAHRVNPGEYYFMTTFFGRHRIMKAKVNADKTYFVLLEPDRGMEFKPIKKGEENPVTKNNVSEMLPAGTNWAPDKIDSAKKHMKNSYQFWDQMPESEKLKHSLNADDGR